MIFLAPSIYPNRVVPKGNSSRVPTAPSVPFLTVGMIPPQNNGCIVPSILLHSSNEGKPQVVKWLSHSPLGAVKTLELFPLETSSGISDFSLKVLYIKKLIFPVMLLGTIAKLI
jgi:hypothetical protein